MATFEVQGEGLTGLAIGGSSNPTSTELAEFLKDGVIDVTRRHLEISPGDADLFSRATSTLSSNGVDLGGPQIISVIREAGSDGDTDGSTAWRDCRKVPAATRSRVVDPDSLNFASKYNPVYIINDNGKVNVYPVASSNNGYRVFYVNNEPKDNTNGAALIYSHSDIRWFPNDKVYLVVLYAAIKSLEAKMAEFTIDEEDIELVQSIATSLGSLKQQYSAAFEIAAPRSANKET